MQTINAVSKPDQPTFKHPNRRAYNWLAYCSGDRFLMTHKSHFRGNLYDLGCGEMPYRDWLLQYVDTYTGVDWSSSLHTLKADIVADLNKPLPIDNQVADTVISLSVMEHLQEPQLFLSEANRILKTGGAIVLQVPWQWWIHEAPYDYFRYTPYGLEFLFKKAGFIDIRIEPQAGFFTMITLKINYFSLRLIRGPRLVQAVTRMCFSVFWFIAQKIAPLLDKLDRNWALESNGYFVTARKS